MTTTPVPSQIVVTGAGEPLAAAFTKVNNNQTAEYAWGQTVDAAISSALTQILALQRLNLVAGAYSPPVGTAAFQYSGNATPWSAATMQTRALLGTPATESSVTTTPVWAYPLNCGNASGNTVLLLWTENAGNTNYNALKACILTIDASGNQTFGNTLSVDNTFTYQTGAVLYFGVLSAVTQGSLNIKLLYYCYSTPSSNTTVYEKIANIIYDGVSTISSSVSQIYSQTNGSILTALPVQAGILCGTASCVFYRKYSDYLGSGGVVFDASNSTINYATYCQDPFALNAVVDTLGSGILVEAFACVSTQDNVSRLTVRINQYNDYGRAILSTIRVGNFPVSGNISSITCLSPALVAVFFTDTGSTRRVALLGISATYQLSLIGVYTAGNFANLTPTFFAQFSTFIDYGIVANAALNSYTLFGMTYNPSATVPGTNDFLSTTSFNYTFGAVASAIQGTLRTVIRLNANQLLFVGYGGTSSAKSVISETVLMS